MNYTLLHLPEPAWVLTKDGRRSGLGKVLAEVGRVIKTVHFLEYVSSEVYRKESKLNHGKSRGQLARVVSHGKRGKVREKFRPGVEG
jgi:TnpA family transposase